MFYNNQPNQNNKFQSRNVKITAIHSAAPHSFDILSNWNFAAVENMTSYWHLCLWQIIIRAPFHGTAYCKVLHKMITLVYLQDSANFPSYHSKWKILCYENYEHARNKLFAKSWKGNSCKHKLFCYRKHKYFGEIGPSSQKEGPVTWQFQ